MSLEQDRAVMGSCDVPSIEVRAPLATRVYVALFAGGFIVFVIVALDPARVRP
jgi:hypothetical protein